MYNPVTSRVVITHDAIWLGRMLYTRLPQKLDHSKMPVVSAPISMNAHKIKDELEMLEVVLQMNVPISEEREGTAIDSQEKSGDWVTTKTRFGCKVGRKSGVCNPATGTTVKWTNMVAAVNIQDPKSYCYVLGINEDKEKVFEDKHNETIKFVNVSTGIGGRFSKTQEL
jgi:hypothetical protein